MAVYRRGKLCVGRYLTRATCKEDEARIEFIYSRWSQSGLGRFVTSVFTTIKSVLTSLKGEDNSPASFEKALSALAGKISKSQAQLDSLHSRGRRFKALWTLYTSVAYMLCVIILLLVVGWKNWGALEYTAVAGSPVL